MAGSSARDAPGGTPDNEAVLGGAAIVVGGAVSLSGLLLYQASAAGGTHVSAVGLVSLAPLAPPPKAVCPLVR